MADEGWRTGADNPEQASHTDSGQTRETENVVGQTEGLPAFSLSAGRAGPANPD